MARDNGTSYVWRGAFTNAEVHALHAEALQTRVYDESGWDWVSQCERYSLGWVVARHDGGRFVGFACEPYDPIHGPMDWYELE